MPATATYVGGGGEGVVKSSLSVDRGHADAVARAFLRHLDAMDPRSVPADAAGLEHLYNMTFKHLPPADPARPLPLLGFLAVADRVLAARCVPPANLSVGGGARAISHGSLSDGTLKIPDTGYSKHMRSPTKLAIDQKQGLFKNKPRPLVVAADAKGASAQRRMVPRLPGFSRSSTISLGDLSV